MFYYTTHFPFHYYCQSLIMPNLEIKLHHKVLKKKYSVIGFSATWCFGYALRVLEISPVGKIRKHKLPIIRDNHHWYFGHLKWSLYVDLHHCLSFSSPINLLSYLFTTLFSIFFTISSSLWHPQVLLLLYDTDSLI